MERAELIAQLGTFASSLCQVIEVLPSLSCMDCAEGAFCTKCQLVETKLDLLRTVADLNYHLYHDDQSQRNDIYIGSVILCPRLYRGKMCWDQGIVTAITKLSETEQPHTFSHITENSGNKSEAELIVIWTHPQSIYESNSSSINFKLDQIRPPTAAVQQKIVNDEGISQIQPGDSVLALQRKPSSNAGVWLSAIVLRLPREGLVEVKYTGIGSSALPTQILRSADVCLPPQPICATTKTSSEYNRSGRRSYSADSDSDGDSDSEREGSVNSNHEGITSIPSYSHAHISNCLHASASYGNFSTSSGHGSHSAGGSSADLHSAFTGAGGPSKVPVGLWEQHTKGVGSKIMRRMGYKMQAGEGLGKSGQGIAAPVEGLVKALPPGLSLDYVSELTKNKDSAQRYGSSSSLAEQLEQRGKDIRMDIVARFNAAHLPGASKHKQHTGKAHKSSTNVSTKTGAKVQQQRSAEREGGWFGLLNHVEGQAPAGSSTGVGNTCPDKGSIYSIGSAAGAVRTSVPRKPAQNMSKLF